MKAKVSDEVKRMLKTVYDDCYDEDRSTRDNQLRQWRRLKLLWEGFQNVWFSEVAHDWRIYTPDLEAEDSDQAYYDKQVNIFKAYLESIIAALSVTIPPIKCFPDDADNSYDLTTAKAGDKICQLIYRHNEAALLWLHALFIFATEGLVACYTYPEEDESYGTYQENKYEVTEEQNQVTRCSLCNFELDSVPVNGSLPAPSIPPTIPNQGTQDYSGEVLSPNEQANPMTEQGDVRPACGEITNPVVGTESNFIEKIVETFTKNKTRIKMEVYGGLYIKIPNYAKNQKKCGYIIKSEEVDYASVCEMYEDLYGNEKLLDYMKTSPGIDENYGPWARLSPQYQGEFPENVVTVNEAWIRPSRYNILKEEKELKELRKQFPKGVKVVFVNEEFAYATGESLDDCWTLLENPLSDYLHFQPQGEGLTSIQDITNELISLVLQTIEHGIGQTFADPGVLNFDAYAQTEVTPGGIFPAKPKTGKSMSDGFHEMKTATLSGEVLPFSQQIQSLGQLVSGALPSLFGGALEGSETASQYSMSRAQALQRQQNTWKMFTIWWKNIFYKAIPKYITNMKDDERDVQKDKKGNFINVVIRKAELEGKIGKVELEANENLPITWGQKKDTIERLMMNANPIAIQILSSPENIPIIHEVLGLPELQVPGEDDVIAEYEEIHLLLNSEPIPNPEDPDMPEKSSVDIDQLYDNHVIRFDVIRSWVVSEGGRQAKIDNETGYRNVLLHGMMHKLEIDRAQMEQSMSANAGQDLGGAANPKKPAKPDMQEAPIQGESDVTAIH